MTAMYAGIFPNMRGYLFGYGKMMTENGAENFFHSTAFL
jgi:hypothetical protein